jgi:hypothetical protein
MPKIIMEFEPKKNEKFYQNDFVTHMRMKDSINEFGDDYMINEKEKGNLK